MTSDPSFHPSFLLFWQWLIVQIPSCVLMCILFYVYGPFFLMHKKFSTLNFFFLFLRSGIFFDIHKVKTRILKKILKCHHRYVRRPRHMVKCANFFFSSIQFFYAFLWIGMMSIVKVCLSVCKSVISKIQTIKLSPTFQHIRFQKLFISKNSKCHINAL